MKVVCINNYKVSLTVDKIYEATVSHLMVDKGMFSFPMKYYKVVNDLDLLCTYESVLFVTLEEHRENQLKKLGI